MPENTANPATAAPVQPSTPTSVQAPATVNPIDQVMPSIAQPPKISVFGYIFWGLAIPPFTTFLSMYFAWKKGALHKLMPDMTIVYSVFFALWSLLMFSAPGAFSSYFTQQVATIPTFDKVTALVLILGGIGSGIYFRMSAKKAGSLSLVWVGLMTVILVLQVWAGFHQLTFISAVVTKAQDINIGL